MQSFVQLAALRRSVRGYKPQPVSSADNDYILRSSLSAPSAVNRQPWHLYIVTSPEAREAVCAAYPGRDWFASAPEYIIVTVDDSAAWTRPCDGHSHADIDAAIIAEHICLAAADRGLGTCWVCNFDPALLSQRLDLPAGRRPVVIIPVGQPAPDSVRPYSRRDPAESVTEL